MHEINLLFLLSSISFVAGLATVNLVNLLQNQDKYRFGKGVKYIGVLSLSLIIGGICNYSYEHNWLGSFIFIPGFSYILFTTLIYYMTNLDTLSSSSLEQKSVGVDPATKFSHQEWQTELLGRTTGASPWTVIDDDINSDWSSLRQSNTRNQMNSLRSDSYGFNKENSAYSSVAKATAETQRRQNKMKYDGKKSKFVDKRNYRGLDTHS